MPVWWPVCLWLTDFIRNKKFVSPRFVTWHRMFFPVPSVSHLLFSFRFSSHICPPHFTICFHLLSSSFPLSFSFLIGISTHASLFTYAPAICFHSHNSFSCNLVFLFQRECINIHTIKTSKPSQWTLHLPRRRRLLPHRHLLGRTHPTMYRILAIHNPIVHASTADRHTPHVVRPSPIRYLRILMILPIASPHACPPRSPSLTITSIHTTPSIMRIARSRIDHSVQINSLPHPINQRILHHHHLHPSAHLDPSTYLSHRPTSIHQSTPIRITSTSTQHVSSKLYTYYLLLLQLRLF